MGLKPEWAGVRFLYSLCLVYIHVCIRCLSYFNEKDTGKRQKWTVTRYMGTTYPLCPEYRRTMKNGSTMHRLTKDTP